MIVQIIAWAHPGHHDLNHADGQEQTGPIAADRRVEVSGGDAQHGEGTAVDEHNLAGDVGRGAETSFPIAVTEDEHRIRILCGIVLWREQASQRGLETKKLKVVAGDDFRVFILGRVAPGNADIGAVGCRDGVKGLVLVAQILVHGIGKIIVHIAAKAGGRAGEAAGPFEADEFGGALNGEHAEEHFIEERENRGVGADAEGKRDNHGERKAG